MRAPLALALALALALPGCLRTKFDHCTESPPNAECPDSGVTFFDDAGTDAGPADATTD